MSQVRQDFEPEITFTVEICGDWSSVIRTVQPDSPQWERLLQQKPMSEEDAEYGSYRLEAATVDELFETAERFRKEKLLVHVGVVIKSKSLGIQASAFTGDGFGQRGVYGLIRQDPVKRDPGYEAAEKLVDWVRQEIRQSLEARNEEDS